MGSLQVRGGSEDSGVPLYMPAVTILYTCLETEVRRTILKCSEACGSMKGVTASVVKVQ